MESSSWGSKLVFFVNGKKIIERTPDPECTLLQYLRRTLLMPGTKEGCGLGGCGACTVMLSRYDKDIQAVKYPFMDIHNVLKEYERNFVSTDYTVNACLYPLCAVHGLAVTTVEGVGNPRTGLHEVQQRLIESHGLQCGFCTPGFVMSVFCLLRNNPTPTQSGLESALEGNLCRCTGYRPIMDAFRPLTVDGCPMGENCCRNQTGNASLKQQTVKYDPNTDQVAIFPPELKLSDQYNQGTVSFQGDKWTWIRPTTLPDLLKLKDKYPSAPIIMGNTAAALQLKKGKFYSSDVLLYGGSIPSLKVVEIKDGCLVAGAAVTLTQFRDGINAVADNLQDSKKRHFPAILEMVRRYGSDQIRNVATLSGSIEPGRSNSDVTAILTALDARMVVASVNGQRTIPLGNRLEDNEVITSIIIPESKEDEHVMFFKQTDRKTFSHAVVNAGCFVSLTGGGEVKVLRMCFGGIGQSLYSSESAKMAIGRSWDDSLLNDIMDSLTTELAGNGHPPNNYNTSVVTSFFFRFYWHIKKVSQHSREDFPESLTYSITEPTVIPSKGSQLIDACTDPGQDDSDGLGRPVPNVASKEIVCGEAVYIDDIPKYDGELFAALVTSTRAHARIVKIDTSKALSLKGVWGYIDHNDVKGDNHIGLTHDEILFAVDEVTWYGQLIGAIVADSREIAHKAAQLVDIQYEDLKATLTIEEAIEEKKFHENVHIVVDGNVEEGFKNSDEIIEGECLSGLQEHFYMEPMCALAVPMSDGDELDVLTATQCLIEAQHDVAAFTGRAESKVKCRVKRLGGGFGGKETRIVFPMIPAAMAADKFKRPVRCVLNRELDMVVTGKRHPILGKYKVGVTKDGKIQALQMRFYNNAGAFMDLALLVMLRCITEFEAGVRIPNMDIKGYVCLTNTPPNTAFRGLGAPQGVVITEDVMFNIACKLGIPEEKIREVNLYQEGDQTAYGVTLTPCTMQQAWDECKRLSDFRERQEKVQEFNRVNRWRKRGLTMTTERFGIGFPALHMYQSTALVNIYRDGSVRLAHGGIEMGQGINTKLIQIASRVLGIPMDLIYNCETSTDTAANSIQTVASMGIDLCGPAVMDACNILSERLKPLRETNPDMPWKNLIGKAFSERVKLTATGFSRYDKKGFPVDLAKKKGQPYDYYTFGAAATEVEIDVLTGQLQVLRTDIVMDIGKSLNPAIDIGQIEGGFVQGLGMMTSEDMTIDSTGRPTNCSPVSYKIPNVHCIPREMNVAVLKNHQIVTPCYSSKGIGEPPLLLSTSVLMAIKEAVRAARAEIGLHGYFRLDSPATVAKIQAACGNQLQLKK